MSVRWYYQNQAGIVGPVSVAELKFLFNVGAIDGLALVRNGEDGPWTAVDQVEGLRTAAGEDAGADDSASEVPEWHFSLKGQDKQGPVPWSVLKAMIAGEKLQSDDLVWKPGMALWVPASQVPGLMAELGDGNSQELGFHGKLRSRARSRVLWVGVAAMVLIGLIAGAVGWKWAKTESREQADARVARARALSDKGRQLKGRLGPVEQLLDDARTAVRVEQLERATRLLDQYLASPGAEQVDAAKLLLREIKRATSVADAARIAQNLADEPLKTYLQQGVETAGRRD